MNRIKGSLVAIGLIALFSGSVRAEDAKPAVSLNDYLQQLQVKLDHTAQRANKPSSGSTSVAGLRGAPQAKSAPLYWKGKKGSEPVNVVEVKAYRDAVEQARAGKRPEAIALLNTFQEKYPKSPLMPDVQETLHRLSQDSAAPAAPASASPAVTTPTPLPTLTGAASKS